jgi:Wiskott-Aldrich syndrome protein
MRTSKFRVKLLVNEDKDAGPSSAPATQERGSGTIEDEDEDEEDQEDQLIDDDDDVRLNAFASSSLPRQPDTKRKATTSKKRAKKGEKKSDDGRGEDDILLSESQTLKLTLKKRAAPKKGPSKPRGKGSTKFARGLILTPTCTNRTLSGQRRILRYSK